LTRETTRRFQFLRKVASGTFGSVFLAKETHVDGFSRLVAIKLLHRRWAENPEIAQRMRDEARLLGWLRNRNIVDVYDLTVIDGRAAVVMEYLEAVDVKTLIEDGVARQRPIPVRAALEIAACVASALDAAYNRPPFPGERPLRVIHRDIKPGNIMIEECGQVKVLDFGVARAEFMSRESSTEDLQFGSIDYMPPERLFFEPETPASDVYSLGSTLYEMLAMERFGKARGRSDRHTVHLRDRLAYLHSTRGIAEPEGDGPARLLLCMLAWEAAERPSAAEVVRQTRELVRRETDGALADWAETTVPFILARSALDQEKERPLSEESFGDDTSLPTPRLPTRPAVEPESAWIPLAPPPPPFEKPALPHPALPPPHPGPPPQVWKAPAKSRPRALFGLVLLAAPLVGLALGVAVSGLLFVVGVPGGSVGSRSSTPSPVAPLPASEQVLSRAADFVRSPAMPAEGSTSSDPGSPLGGGQVGKAAPESTQAPAGGAFAEGAPAEGAPAEGARHEAANAGDATGTKQHPLPTDPAGRSPTSGAEPSAPASAEAPIEAGSSPVSAPLPAPSVGSVDEPASVAPRARSTRFVSAEKTVKNLQVRCRVGEAQGALSAEFDTEGAGPCTVTAIRSDRSRIVAVIAQIRPGSYLCFAQGRSRCERQDETARQAPEP
jgi:serine/threonine protein kinase